jgi:predicted PurR-regulated permease PerM
MEHGNPEDNSFRGDLFVDDVDRMVAEKAIKDKINNWYVEVYQPQYIELSHEITQYMTGVHNTLGPEVNNLSHTARRTVTPVFITLLVMIAIVLVFYFFMMIYVVKPIKRINKSLGTYLAYKTPFDDSILSRDEIRTLRDRIAALISRIR